jgi:hypothetical protein
MENRRTQRPGSRSEVSVEVIDPSAPRSVAIHDAAASPLDLPTEVFASGLERRKVNRRALIEWIRSSLVDGVDFGRVPTKRGPSKPSLWKPGAEKICGMLGVTVRFPTLERYEEAALNGVEFKQVIIRCEILDGAGRVVASGIGARGLAQDYGDINKVLKMAEKSAHIDATLRMAGLSELFTQDLEDLAAVTVVTAERSEARPVSPANNPSNDTACSEGQHGRRISTKQRQGLEARIARAGIDRDRVEAWLRRVSRGKVNRFEELTQGQFEKLIERLDQWMSQRKQATNA